jgi:phage terminase large subunit
VIDFEYKPLSVFQPFHRSAARHRCIIGGYGSGKSKAGVAEMIAWGLEHPGSEFLITRKTVPALKSTTEKMFLDSLPPDFLAAVRPQEAPAATSTRWSSRTGRSTRSRAWTTGASCAR